MDGYLPIELRTTIAYTGGREADRSAAWLALSFRAAPSPSCSPTSRARRSCCTSSGRGRTRRRSRSIGGSSARGLRAPRRASRSTRRATRSSSLRDGAGCARGGAQRGAGLRSRSGCGWGSAHRRAAPDRRGLRRRSTSTARRGSRPPATAARCSSRPRRAALARGDGAARSRRAPAQGPRPRPSGSTSSATSDFPPLRRSTRRTCRCRRRRSSGASASSPRSSSCSARRRSPAHAHRAGRHRQDAARAPGGGGAAERYPDGVFWVPLAPLRDPALVARERRAGARRRANGLVEHRRRQARCCSCSTTSSSSSARRPSSPSCSRRCPNLESRSSRAASPCSVPAEQSYPVPPLDADDGGASSSWRARRRSSPTFEPDDALPSSAAGSTTCRWRSSSRPRAYASSSPQQLLERLAQRLDLLKGGPRRRSAPADAARDDRVELRPARRGRAAAVRAPGRLPRRLHARRCRGGRRRRPRHAAVARRQEPARGTQTSASGCSRRSVSTQESVSLRAGEEADLRQRHAVSALEFVEAVWRDLEEGGDQMVGLAQIDVEHDNLRAALEWARDSRADEVLLRLVAALTQFWPRRGYYGEADSWFPLALDADRHRRRHECRCCAVPPCARRQRETTTARTRTWLSGAASPSSTGDEGQLLRAMNSAALDASEQGDLDRARAEFVAIGERAREIGDRMMVAFVTINLGMVAWEGRDFQTALEYSERAVDLFRELGDLGGVATALGTCGWSNLALSDPDMHRPRSARPLRWPAAWGRSAALLSMQRASRRRSSPGAGRSRRHSFTERSLRSMKSSASFSTMLSRSRSMRGRSRRRRQHSTTTRFRLPGREAEGMTPEEIVAFVEAEQSVRSPS